MGTTRLLLHARPALLLHPTARSLMNNDSEAAEADADHDTVLAPHTYQRRHPAELAATQRLLTRDLWRRAGVVPSAVSAPPEPPSHPPTCHMTPLRPWSARSGIKAKLAKLLVKAPRSPLQRVWKAFVVGCHG